MEPTFAGRAFNHIRSRASLIGRAPRRNGCHDGEEGFHPSLTPFVVGGYFFGSGPAQFGAFKSARFAFPFSEEAGLVRPYQWRIFYTGLARLHSLARCSIVDAPAVAVSGIALQFAHNAVRPFSCSRSVGAVASACERVACCSSLVVSERAVRARLVSVCIVSTIGHIVSVSKYLIPTLSAASARRDNLSRSLPISPRWQAARSAASSRSIDLDV